MERLDQAPGFVRRAVAWRYGSKMKNIHYGQVLPIEDVERIFYFITSVVRLACICREATLVSEQRLCQFGAMSYSAAQKRVMIDPRRCYGCGVCHSALH